MCKFCWTLLILLLVAAGVAVYKFGVVGSVQPAADSRMALQLTSAERNLVLTEMRDFLVSVQRILAAVPKEQMQEVAEAARKVGRAAQQGVPLGLMTKLPIEFKKLGFDTHSRFDQLALDAEQLGDKEHTLEQLATLMANCVACHAAYSLETSEK